MKPLIAGVLDGPGLELHPRFAPNVVTTLGRLAGRTVGVIANNPLRLGGCLDSASAEKAARFVRMCDAFGVPLVVLVDVPGYLPGVGQEWDGVVRRGAKLLHAFAEAVVPRVTLVTRKSYGGAYIAMNARSLGATAVFAWPGAEVAVMGAKAAVGILHRKKLAAVPPGEREALHAQLAEEHERIAGGVNRALQIGVVDEVVRAVADQAPAGRRRSPPPRPAAARTATSRSDPLRPGRLIVLASWLTVDGEPGPGRVSQDATVGAVDRASRRAAHEKGRPDAASPTAPGRPGLRLRRLPVRRPSVVASDS